MMGLEENVIDWVFAVKIACGGFTLVFIVLVLLGISVWVIRLIVYKVFHGEKE